MLVSPLLQECKETLRREGEDCSVLGNKVCPAVGPGSRNSPRAAADGCRYGRLPIAPLNNPKSLHFEAVFEHDLAALRRQL
jgi:hypothetical protein